ncbi:MAG TPA: hypothetical protein V6D29_20385 [Leptolyngbyaceae cyanobacterium]
MVQGVPSQNRQQIQKALKRGAKAVLMSRGMNPSTRRGNKELENLLNQLGQKSYASVEDAIRMGEALGWEIVKLSEKRNQKNLDASVIRQVAESGNLLSELTPNSDKDQPQVESLESGIKVEIDMKQGASPIEKTPEVHVSGQAANTTSSGASSAGSSGKENKVTSEPVSAKGQEDNFAATVGDVEDEIPAPKSISHAETITGVNRAPDGQDMDSEAPEEAAAADADEVEDVLPEPDAKTEGLDADVSVSVASKGSEGVDDSDEGENAEDFVREEAVSVASKVSGEDPEIMQARR